MPSVKTGGEKTHKDKNGLDLIITYASAVAALVRDHLFETRFILYIFQCIMWHYEHAKGDRFGIYLAVQKLGISEAMWTDSRNRILNNTSTVGTSWIDASLNYHYHQFRGVQTGLICIY